MYGENTLHFSELSVEYIVFEACLIRFLRLWWRHACGSVGECAIFLNNEMFVCFALVCLVICVYLFVRKPVHFKSVWSLKGFWDYIYRAQVSIAPPNPWNSIQNTWYIYIG